jgi:pyridoxine 5-phosphate synthase
LPTIRNSRGGNVPSVLQAWTSASRQARPASPSIRAPTSGNIRANDAREIARHLASRGDRVEFNIEGDPRPDFVALVLEVRPHQCTLVPVKAGEITSQAAGRPTPVPTRCSARSRICARPVFA